MPRLIRLYPGFNALYYSFYLAGLEKLKVKIRYRRSAFPDLGHHGLAFETLEADPKRIFLSASDGPGINPKALEWCDVYGKVNLDLDRLTARAAEKSLAIGPSFPVRLWDPIPALSRALLNFLRCSGRIESPREHFANFYRQYRYRLPLAAFEPEPSESPYVFFASSLWKKEIETNRYRACFIEACRELSEVDFEGGFVPRSRDDMPEFRALTVERRYAAGLQAGGSRGL